MYNPGNLSSTTLVVPHNLGYPPLTFVWFYGQDLSDIGPTAMRVVMPVDNTNVYINTFSLGLTQNQINVILRSSNIDVKCLNVDLSKDVDYALAAQSTFNTPYDPNYGIKMVKTGGNINSKDLRSFTLHSRAQSPLVLAVKTQDTSNKQNPNVVQYISKFNYPSWVYGFIKIGTTLATNTQLPVNAYIPAPYYSQAYPKTVTDGTTSYIQFNTGDNGASLVVLRDPMFAPTQTVAQYV